eukprot:IDg8402t1
MTRFAILSALPERKWSRLRRQYGNSLAPLVCRKIIQSDNGSEFVNQLISELVTLNGIEQRTISPYNPRANGAVERLNGTVETMLKKKLGGAMHKSPNKFEKYGQTKTKSELSVVLWKKKQDELAKVVYLAVRTRVLKEKGKMVADFNSSHRPIHRRAQERGGAYILKDKLGQLKRTVPADQLKLIVRHEDGAAIEDPTHE